MKIDNYRKAVQTKFYMLLSLVIALALIVYSFIAYDYLKWLWISLAGILFVLYLSFAIRNIYYFYIELRHNSILVRYYNIHPFLSKRKSFQIPLNNFVAYEIKTKFFGLHKYIIFKIKKNNKLLEYPRVSISGLKMSEIEEMKKGLDNVLKIKNLR
jgi:hypothetical protein